MIDFSQIPNKLDVTLYGKSEQVTDTISKCRVRIFYKGMNRNRTFISEEFANQLISSLPYAPIKGIFNKDKVDYEDHGWDNTDGRIYGIVPETSNFAWEEHMDADGVTRQYACCDVYLFTGLYPEAKLIPESSQSMEIYRGSLKGEWRISDTDREPYYYFLEGSLVGLQVLGMDTEPCFEGAAFYSLKDKEQFELLFQMLKDVVQPKEKVKEKFEKEESIEMDKSLFRISDNEKADILFDLLNPNLETKGVENWIMDVYEDYCICRSKEGFKRVYYTKDGDNISIGDSVDVKIVDITESEYNALESIKSIGGTYEAAQVAYNESVNRVADLENEIENYKKSSELVEETEEDTTSNEEEKVETEETVDNTEEVNSEYQKKIDELTAEKAVLENKLSEITNENNSLIEYKRTIENQKKKEIIQKYAEYLSDSTIEELNSKIDTYSVEDFKKEVCTAAVENNMSVLSKKNEEVPTIFYKGGIPDTDKSVAETPVIRLLNKYKNGGNKNGD